VPSTRRQFLLQTAAAGALAAAHNLIPQFSYGVRPSSETIEWNCRLPEYTESTTCKWGTAELHTDHTGSSLTLAGKQLARVRGTARLVTTSEGKLLRLIATEPRSVTVLVQSGRRSATHNLNPDNVIAF
jgi:hypothetical protein